MRVVFRSGEDTEPPKKKVSKKTEALERAKRWMEARLAKDWKKAVRHFEKLDQRQAERNDPKSDR